MTAAGHWRKPTECAPQLCRQKPPAGLNVIVRVDRGLGSQGGQRAALSVGDTERLPARQ